MYEIKQWIPAEPKFGEPHVPVTLNTVLDDVPEWMAPTASPPNMTNDADADADADGDNCSEVSASGHAADERRVLAECTVHYLPQNPIASLCAPAFGPPIVSLRKDAVHCRKVSAEVMNNQFDRIRSVKWWLCHTALKLALYSDHGESMPKLIISLVEAKLWLSGVGLNVAVVLMSDGRAWPFEFENEFDAKRFVFSVCETQRSLREPSIYMRSPSLLTLRPFGHDCPVVS